MTVVKLSTMFRGREFDTGKFEIRPTEPTPRLAHMSLIDADGNLAYVVVDKEGIMKMMEALQEQVRSMDAAEGETE